MNLFKEFKEVLTNVSDEIKNNLKIQNKNDYKDLTIYAGQGSINLLKKKKNDADVIHNETISISNMIKVTDNYVNNLFAIYSLNFTMMKNLECELACIPQIKFNLATLNNIIIDMTEAIEKVEEDLSHLENQIEWEQLKKCENNQKQGLLLHETNWKRKNDKMQISLAKKHSEYLASRENDYHKLLLERQQTFEKEYQIDLDNYVNKGIIRKESLEATIIITESPEISSELMDFKELNEFLEND